MFSFVKPAGVGFAIGVTALTCGASAFADGSGPATISPLPVNFSAYLDSQQDTCVGPLDGKQAKPTEYDLHGFHYWIDGAQARVTRKGQRSGEGIRLGVLNAIKDAEPATLANLDSFMAKFKAADVDGIVVGGDTAYDQDDIDTILEHVAGMGVPVYVIIGNAESTGSFNFAVQTAYGNKKNIISLDMVRTVTADGFDLVSLPGYYDRRFASQVAPCLYKPADAKQLVKLGQGVPGPIIAVSHGPPKQSGVRAIDYVANSTPGNVGDENLAHALAKAKISFGIFGHIVEAGGRGTNPDGTQLVREGVLADALYLNPGSADSVPWAMNGGGESWGMAALLTIQGHQAKYEIYRRPKPKDTNAGE